MNSVGVQERYKVASGSSSAADTPIRKATEYYVNPNIPTIEELRQQSQAEKQKVEGREEWAVNKEIAKVGEWETVVVAKPAANSRLDAAAKTERENAGSTATHDQGAEFQDDDEDQEDLHHFKIREKEYPADVDILPEDQQEPLTFKKRKADSSDSTTFKARKKKPLRKKD